MTGILEDPLITPVGTYILELRADSDLTALVSGRIRAFEPLGASATYEGDALSPGSYKAFVVVKAQSVPPHPRLPITDAELLVQCYGVTAQNASEVYGAVVKATHGVGARVRANSIGIYRSWIIAGGEQLKDPDTRQPYVEAVARFIATAQAVTA